jgi:hypothetical protein
MKRFSPLMLVPFATLSHNCARTWPVHRQKKIRRDCDNLSHCRERHSSVCDGRRLPLCHPDAQTAKDGMDFISDSFRYDPALLCAQEAELCQKFLPWKMQARRLALRNEKSVVSANFPTQLAKNPSSHSLGRRDTPKTHLIWHPVDGIPPNLWVLPANGSPSSHNEPVFRTRQRTRLKKFRMPKWHCEFRL